MPNKNNCDNGFNASASGRIEIFDALKGIAMLLVVADHCGMLLLTVFDYFEVPAFFVISGYFFRHKDGLLIEKLKRLIVPYIIYNVAYMAAWASVGGEITLEFAVNGLMWSANFPLWFFKALFWTFVLAFVLTRGGRSLSMSHVAAMAAVFVAAGVGLTLIGIPGKALFLGLAQAAVVLPLFFFGIFMKITGLAERVKGWFARRWTAMAAGVAALGICSLLWHGALGLNDANIGNPSVFYLYTPVVFFGFYLIAIGLWKRVADALAYVGRCSLFVFCVHAIFILYLRRFVDDEIVLFVVTAVLSILTASIAGRVPWLRRLYLV